MENQEMKFGWQVKDSFNSIMFCILTLAFVFLFTGTNFAPIGFILYSFVTILLFLVGLAYYPNRFIRLSNTKRIKNLFLLALFIKAVFLLVLFIYYYSLDKTLFGPNAADVTGYHYIPMWMANEYSATGTLDYRYYSDMVGSISDMGYIYWTFFWYVIFGPNLWLHGALNVIISCFSVILVYKIASRQFDEKVGIISAIMMLLHPYFFYYNSQAMKETLMLWIILVFFLNAQAYFIYSKRKMLHLTVALLALLSLAFFRNFLAIILASGFLIQFLFFSIRRGRVTIVVISGLIILGFYSLFMSLNILNEFDSTISTSADSFDQVLARRSANSLVNKYSSLPAFLVLTFSGPLPSAVNIPEQENILLQMSGAFIRNIMVIISMFGIWFALKGDLRKNILYIFFIFVYLFVVAYSGYGNSNRYNLIVLPILLIYTAKGVQSMAFKQWRAHNVYLFILLFVILAWNYSKLMGRGII